MAIRVSTINPISGACFDLTDRVDGLSYSNVNPGGHERCSFSLKSAWGSGFPEIRRGNIVRVEDMGRDLFTGRIDDHDPQLQDAEQISVTAYGLGVRMKDDTMREIYVDCDLSAWRPASVARKIAVVSGGGNVQDASVNPDTTNGQQSLLLELTGSWSGFNEAEAYYDAKGIPIGSVYYAAKTNANIGAGGGSWSAGVDLFDNDTPSGTSDAGAVTFSTGGSTGTVTSTTSTRVFVLALLQYGISGGTAGAHYDMFFTQLAVYGKHGLTKQGSESATSHKGFFASQVVADIVGRVPGIEPRRIDTSSFVIPQLVFLDDTTHEDAITAASKFDQVDWGVWGSDSFFGGIDSDVMTGYLDWSARNLTDQSWTVYRDECDELDLHTELGSTYDQVAVTYTDPTGQAHRELRSITSTALVDANIPHRTATLQGGTLTQSGAQQLGDAFLLLNDGSPVSRGTAQLKGLVKHNVRGLTPAHHMRADGSNLYVPDAFPDRDSLALITQPDRRSIFPIKRVTVDCSGDAPQTTVELDQANDLLSALTARLAVEAQVLIGS